jgi:hypothetical protein
MLHYLIPLTAAIWRSSVRSQQLTREQRNTIETEIRAALMALDHYRKALALERQAISED